MAMPNFCVGDPTQPIFHWLAVGFCIGDSASFMFYVGGNANSSVFRYWFLQHKIVSLAMLGVNATTQRKCFCNAVEYKLYFACITSLGGGGGGERTPMRDFSVINTNMFVSKKPRGSKANPYISSQHELGNIIALGNIRIGPCIGHVYFMLFV